MTILEVNNLKKIYTTRLGGNQVQALTDVSFSVEQGEYVAIMGESGSGKTTLLNILAALDRATSGEVLLDGKKLSEIKERQLSAFRRDNLGYPSDFMMTVESEQLPDEWEQAINQEIEETQMEVTRHYVYQYYDFAALKAGDTIYADANAFASVENAKIYYCFLISIDDYNRISGETEELQDGESLVYCRDDRFESGVWNLYGKSYRVRKQLQSFIPMYSNSVFTEAYMVMTKHDIQSIMESIQAEQGNLAGGISTIVGYDFHGSVQEKHELYQRIERQFADQGWLKTNGVQLFEQKDIRDTFLNAYGGLLFIGCIFGCVFAFGILYVAVYAITSRVYYRLVQWS